MAELTYCSLTPWTFLLSVRCICNRWLQSRWLLKSLLSSLSGRIAVQLDLDVLVLLSFCSVVVEVAAVIVMWEDCIPFGLKCPGSIEFLFIKGRHWQ